MNRPCIPIWKPGWFGLAGARWGIGAGDNGADAPRKRPGFDPNQLGFQDVGAVYRFRLAALEAPAPAGLENAQPLCQ